MDKIHCDQHYGLQRIAEGYSLFWLAMANAIGLWLAALLVWPQLGRFIEPFGYGRWMPLHMDWQLYGWCSLPLVGLLMKIFIHPGPDETRLANLSFALWSAALLVGGFAWLSGSTSGKLFLNWSGISRFFFPLSMLFLWSVLVEGNRRRMWRNGKNLSAALRAGELLRWLLLLALLSVPILMFWSSGRKVYPPVNPSSGGATGHSLLLSSLSIIFLFALTPRLLNRQRLSGKAAGYVMVTYLVATLLLYMGIGHGHAANRDWDQILGLGSLMLSIPVIIYFFNSYSWLQGSRQWLIAFYCWWGLLAVTGFLSFLPDTLSVLKFTNGLVAHAHLAMAGMLTSINALILMHLVDGQKSCSALAGKLPFALWQAGCIVYVVAMYWQGWREGASPDVLLQPDRITRIGYMIRWLAGGLMTYASFWWLLKWFKQRSEITAHREQREALAV